MEPALDLNLILYFLLALMLVFLAAILATYFLVNRWRKKVDDALIQLGADLNEAGLKIETLQAVQREYDGLHRQPYVDVADELQTRINRALQDAQSLENRWMDLNARHNQVPLSRLQALIDLVPGAYHNQKAVDLMWQQRDRIQKQLAEMESLANRLETLPTEMHTRTVLAGESLRNLEARLSDLHEAGLHGKHVEEADDVLLRVQQGWQRIPVEFASGQPPDAQLGEVRETTSAVYTVLSDIQPLLDEWLERVTGWEKQYRRAVDSYERLRKTATHYRSALDAPPVTLIVDGFLGELEKVRSTARALNKRLQEPLVEDLRALERETAHLEKVVQDSAARYDKTVRRVEELDRALLELDTQLKETARRITEPEKLQVFPMNWDITRPVLMDLQTKTDVLGGREHKRTPDEVEDALRGAADLTSQAKLFDNRVNLVLDRHRELLGLLGTGSIADGRQFVTEVRGLARRVQAYDPSNWSSQDQAGSLPGEVAQLEELQRRLSEVEQPAPLKESELTDRLEEARRLSELHAQLRVKSGRLQAQLDEIQKVEGNTRDEVERASKTVESLALLLRDNPSLQEIAAADVNRYRTDLATMARDLDNPAYGSVGRKASRANALLDQLSRSTSGWLDKLAANLQVYTRRMNDMLADLDRFANMDDRVVTDARRQLERLGPNPVNRKSGLTYMDAAAELKRWNNDWQTSAAVTQALETLSGPVLEAGRDAEQARQAAKTAFQAAGKLASGRRDWPPTRQSLAADVRSFQELERRLDGMRSKRMSSGALVRELGQIYHELDGMEDRVTAAVRQAEAEQQEAVGVERQVTELQQRWQALAQLHPGETDLDLEIKDLVHQVDQRLAQLQAQYKRGQITYDQALSGLRELVTLLRNTHFNGKDGQDVRLTIS